MKENFTDEEIAVVFWDSLKRDPSNRERRQTAWGTKTKIGLVATIKRLGGGDDEGGESDLDAGGRMTPDAIDEGNKTPTPSDCPFCGQRKSAPPIDEECEH